MWVMVILCMMLLSQPEKLREPPRPVPQVGGVTARAQLAAWLNHSPDRSAQISVRFWEGGPAYRVSLIESLADDHSVVTEYDHNLDEAIHRAIRRWSLQRWDRRFFASVSVADNWTPAEMPTPPDCWRPLDLPTRPEPEQVRPSPQPHGGYYSPPRYYCPPFGG